MTIAQTRTIYTFGYGNRTSYLELLNYFKEFDIKAFIDVRRSPRAWTPLWHGSELKKLCLSEGVEYYSFPELGNTSKTAIWVPPDRGEADQALDSVAEIARSGNIVLVCAEKKIEQCHRLAVSKAIEERTNFPIHHLK